MHVGFFLIAITLYTVVSGKSVPSTAALHEDELRKTYEIAKNTYVLQDHGDIMKWNCSEETSSGSDCTTATPETAASDIASVVTREKIASLGVEDKPTKLDPQELDKTADDQLKTPEKGNVFFDGTEKQDSQSKISLNTFAILYREVLQSQHYLPADNVTVEFHWDIYENSNEENVVQSQQGARETRATADENPSGFQIVGDKDGGKNCICSDNGQQSVSSGSFPIKILIGEGNGITVFDVGRPENSTVLTLPLLRAYSIDFHYQKELIFFTGNGKIRSTTKLLVSEGVDGPVRIAVDWIHDRLYFISDKYQKLEMVNLEGSNRTILFDTRVFFTYPNNVVVDPYQKYLFFVSNQTIFRTDLEGKNLIRVDPEIEKERGVKYVALDIHKKRLYFTGRLNKTSGNPYVASSDYDGQGIRNHELGNVTWNDIYSLSVWNDTLYLAQYTTQKKDVVWSLNLAHPEAVPQTLYSSPPTRGGIWSIRMYHPVLQTSTDESDLPLIYTHT